MHGHKRPRVHILCPNVCVALDEIAYPSISPIQLGIREHNCTRSSSLTVVNPSHDRIPAIHRGFPTVETNTERVVSGHLERYRKGG